MKRIQDSVHGCIIVDNLFFKHIIDTPNYQRLRHIEQTSIRSIFPSARHDRFIHSLGVFHIGQMISNHLEKEWTNWGIAEARKSIIVQSYLIACLLHDVGHAPFSHTFEHYYGNHKDLAKQLCELQDDNFSKDLGVHNARNSAPHEYTSAIITHKIYGRAVEILGGNIDLVIRMIIGCHYQDTTKQIENCFISLLHGDVIDADRLDYACRDVWASGYCTSTIDLNRLVSAIHIKANRKKQFVVCFNSNAINEIESVINVKDFQVKYVLNHHTVKYDQWLLVKAVENIALKLFPQDKETKDEDIVAKAMKKLCNIKYLHEDSIDDIKNNIKYLTDADFIFLMKQDVGNNYFNEWFGRQYAMFPLWKSKEEFYLNFNKISAAEDLQDCVFKDTIKRVVCSIDGYSESDVLILEAKYKPRVKMDNLYIVIHENIIQYKDLQTQLYEENRVDHTFYYVYINKQGLSKEGIDEKRKIILSKLVEPLTEIYKKESL